MLSRSPCDNSRTFQAEDGSLAVYDYTSSSARQRKRIQDLGLASHSLAQEDSIHRWLSESPIEHLIYSVQMDETNVWVLGTAFEASLEGSVYAVCDMVSGSLKTEESKLSVC